MVVECLGLHRPMIAFGYFLPHSFYAINNKWIHQMILFENISGSLYCKNAVMSQELYIGKFVYQHKRFEQDGQ